MSGLAGLSFSMSWGPDETPVSRSSGSGSPAAFDPGQGQGIGIFIITLCTLPLGFNTWTISPLIGSTNNNKIVSTAPPPHTHQVCSFLSKSFPKYRPFFWSDRQCSGGNFWSFVHRDGFPLTILAIDRGHSRDPLFFPPKPDKWAHVYLHSHLQILHTTRFSQYAILCIIFKKNTGRF